MNRFWILLHLLFLSAEDIREGQLSMSVIAELGIVGIGHAVFYRQAPALIPGLVLLIFSYFSEEQIGYGDGWLVLALGMWMELHALLMMFWTGLILSAVSAVWLGKKELPFVPFLTAAYIIGEWIWIRT